MGVKQTLISIILTAYAVVLMRQRGFGEFLGVFLQINHALAEDVIIEKIKENGENEGSEQQPTLDEIPGDQYEYNRENPDALLMKNDWVRSTMFALKRLSKTEEGLLCGLGLELWKFGGTRVGLRGHHLS